MKRKRIACFTLFSIIFTLLIFTNSYEGKADMDKTMEFKALLRERIQEILHEWPIRDQYAIMFLINSNEANEYEGYQNLPEFTCMYKCESDMETSHNPFFPALDEDEEHWNPAFWDYDTEQPVIYYQETNQMADLLIKWYQAIGVQDIGYEDPALRYDTNMIYIGKGPNGLQELLQLVVEITKEMQTDGTIEKIFGKKIPVILADFEFSWYMVKATYDANPNGEADNYIDACLRQEYITAEQIGLTETDESDNLSP